MTAKDRKHPPEKSKTMNDKVTPGGNEQLDREDLAQFHHEYYDNSIKIMDLCLLNKSELL